MENVDINHLAVITAALSMFIIGGIWYSPALFGNKWLKALGRNTDFLQTGNKAKIFGGSFLLALISAYTLAGFVSGYQNWQWGLVGGLLVGFGWLAPSFGIVYLFERKCFAHFAINTGYLIISYLVMGLIIGVWK